MPDPTEQDIHEGTQNLKDLADEVEAEREQGKAALMPDDATPEDDATTREDHDNGDELEVDVPPAVANINGRT